MKELALFNNDLGLLVVNIQINGEMMNLTDLWKAAGSPKSKDLRFWLRQDGTVELINSVCRKLNVIQNHVLIVKRGRSGGTWGHKLIALSYAGYLDKKIEVAVNQVFFERVEEEKDPEKAVIRVVKTYERKGKSADWIDTRIQGISSRNTYTHTLSIHGVKQEGFKNCTNAIYTPLFGGTTSVIRHKKGLDTSANIRDNLSIIELRSIEFAELLAKENIEKNRLTGNAQCEIASRHASKSVASAIIQATKQQK
jgi:hypothetical protein